MVTIGTADPMLALVRAQLERLAKAKSGRSAAASGKTDTASAPAKGRIQAIAGLADLPEEKFKRALLGVLLTHEFGENVAADPRFQSVIDRAAEMMTGDPRLADMLADVRLGLLTGKES